MDKQDVRPRMVKMSHIPWGACHHTSKRLRCTKLYMYVYCIYIYVVIYIDVKNYGCQWEWIKMAGHPILVELHASQHTTTWRILCGSNFGWCFWVVMLPKLLWSTQFCQPKKNIQKQPTMQQKQPTTTWHHHKHILSDLPSLARLFFHKSSPFKHTSMYIYIQYIHQRSTATVYCFKRRSLYIWMEIIKSQFFPTI